MTDDPLLPFDLPAVQGKKLTIDFDGGNQSSDAGLLLLREAERQTGVCRRLADAMPDHRDPARVDHTMFELIMERTSAIACGYKDGIDLNELRHDPLMKVVVGRCPETGDPLGSQSTISRLENAPTKTQAARLTVALLDQFCASVIPGKEEIFDIDDAFYVAHGGQQLALWNGHEDERGFSPMHIHHVRTGLPVVPILRSAKTPKGTEVRTVIKHLTKRIREHWPNTRIVWRGDSHYGRVEAMDWLEQNDCGYIFGLPGNNVLDGFIARAADYLHVRHAMGSEEKLRCYESFMYQAGSWSRPRRVVARLEVSWQPDPKAPGCVRQELDTRYVVTTLAGNPQHVYDQAYCQRGQMENLIKLHKAQLASNRTSCHSATANQVRLVLHTAAFWLMAAIRSAIPKTHRMAKAEFATIRDRLIKVGARVIEHVARIRIHLPTSYPEAALFRQVALGLMPAVP